MKQVLRFAVTLSAIVALGGCYAEQAATGEEDTLSAAGKKQKPVPSPIATATPTPTPTATPTPVLTGSPVVVAPDTTGIRQLASIASNFDGNSLVVSEPVPGSADPDVVGAFRFTCKPSHLLYDDPIVFPGQAGRAHLHQFFGNTKANAYSSYESLRTTGDSTCTNMLNRSAYWIPAMMDGHGKVVVPDEFVIYYKRRPASDPICSTGKGCITIPRGLRFVFGKTSTGATSTGYVSFGCINGLDNGSYKTLPEAAARCTLGNQIIASVDAPECWDGVDLDSPDNRSHMADGIHVDGRPACPTTHPYRLPGFTIKALYMVTNTLDRSGDLSTSRPTWHFSSDRMPGLAAQVAGTTFHADWYGAWDDVILNEWTANCLDKKLSCSGGNLGSGRRMIHNALAGNNSHARLVDVPARPVI